MFAPHHQALSHWHNRYTCRQNASVLSRTHQTCSGTTSLHEHCYDTHAGADPIGDLHDEDAKRVAQEFRLNADQTAVLVHCSRWAVADKVGHCQEACIEALVRILLRFAQFGLLQGTEAPFMRLDGVDFAFCYLFCIKLCSLLGCCQRENLSSEHI